MYKVINYNTRNNTTWFAMCIPISLTFEVWSAEKALKVPAEIIPDHSEGGLNYYPALDIKFYRNCFINGRDEQRACLTFFSVTKRLYTNWIFVSLNKFDRNYHQKRRSAREAWYDRDMTMYIFKRKAVLFIKF